MLLPEDLTPYRIGGLEMKVLAPEDKPAMMALQREALSALPDPRWYFPSEEWEFDSWLKNGEAVGYLDGDTLAGYAVATPYALRGEHSYALILGDPPENTFDFHDVIVRAEYRRRGIQGSFLRLFTCIARLAGGTAIYATVDPDNGASWRNFEREGYEQTALRNAYDGRPRRYYRKKL